MVRKQLIALLLLSGCGEKAPLARQRDIVALEAVPAAAMVAAKKEHPDVTFESAWKTEQGNYEIRGKAKSGKIHDVQVTEAGQVLEVD